MMRFIIVHDETVDLAFKHFNLDLSHRVGSLMAIQSVVQTSLVTFKPSTRLNSSLSIDEVRMEIASALQ
jgi:hypothetical protein